MGSATMTGPLTDRLSRNLDGSFRELITTYQDGIYSGVRRLSPGASDAEDITQETFIRAYRALQGYDRDRILDLRLRPWLWTIALNLCRNAARSRSRRPATVAIRPEHDGAHLGSLEDDAAFGADEVRWQQRLDQLPARQRTAVVLRHIADLDYAEIAHTLDAPEGSVKSDVHRGLKKLRSIIETEETT